MLFLQPLQAVAGGATCRSFRASVVRPVGPLAQRVSVIQPGGPDRCPGPYPVGAACHTLRRLVRFSVEAMCFCSGNSACERGPLSPASTPVRRSRWAGRSGPGLGGRLPSARGVGLCRRPGDPRLPAVAPPKPASPGLRCQTASKAIPSAALRGLVGLETLALGPAARSSTVSTISPAPVTRPRDSKPTRSTRNPRSGGSAYGSGVPRSGDGN